MSRGRHDRCDNWEYKTHPNIKRLQTRSEGLVEVIRRHPRLSRRYGFDTRPAHRFLFSPFVPPKCRCLAGNYRGTSACSHLRNLRVTLGPAEPLVGSPPEKVEKEISELEARLRQLEEAFETWSNAGAPKPPPEVAVARLVANIAIALERFLTIHPYANGNGHCGRLLAWALFARQGFFPVGLPLDERPPYDAALYEHRRGNRLPLQTVLLQAYLGWGARGSAGQS